MMAGQIFEWEWVESVGNYKVGDYEVWRRLTGSGSYCYQLTGYGEDKPTYYAGYADKNALLRMKGLI